MKNYGKILKNRVRPDIFKEVEGFTIKVNPQHPKTGRNEACPCGSGKKYKRCCLGNE